MPDMLPPILTLILALISTGFPRRAGMVLPISSGMVTLKLAGARFWAITLIMCTPRELNLSSATPSAPVVTFCPFEDSTMAPAIGESPSSIAFTETLKRGKLGMLGIDKFAHEESIMMPQKTITILLNDIHFGSISQCLRDLICPLNIANIGKEQAIF